MGSSSTNVVFATSALNTSSCAITGLGAAVTTVPNTSAVSDLMDHARLTLSFDTTPATPMHLDIELLLRLAGDPPAGARVWAEGRAPPGAHTPLPLERSVPASFKRLLGSRMSL